MLESLHDKLQAALSEVRGRGTLDDESINKAMRQIRLALLEADVNFKVVKEFTDTVKERSLGADVQKSLNPGQQVVKIVNQELVKVMGSSASPIAFSSSGPTVILMAGLQGSGKTTACGKLAAYLKSQQKQPSLAACDVYRPAAVEQLEAVGKRAGVPVYQQGTDRDPVDIAEWAVSKAKSEGRDTVVVDTAGRLHVDEQMMDELAEIKKRIKPHNVLLVLDAMTGQEAVSVAEQFAVIADFDGVVLTKLDGDARGGAALSVRQVTGKPIKFISTGEAVGSFELFHPDRMASRILGMGDVLSFIEKAEQAVDADDAAELEKKIMRDSFTLDDFLKQIKQIRRMGSLTSILKMIPGVAGNKQLRGLNVDERELDRIQAMITSMTPEERLRPEIIKGSRRKRIASGSGTTVQAVSRLVKQFEEMKKLMKALKKGKMPQLSQLMGGR